MQSLHKLGQAYLLVCSHSQREQRRIAKSNCRLDTAPPGRGMYLQVCGHRRAEREQRRIAAATTIPDHAAATQSGVDVARKSQLTLARKSLTDFVLKSLATAPLRHWNTSLLDLSSAQTLHRCGKRSMSYIRALADNYAYLHLNKSPLSFLYPIINYKI